MPVYFSALSITLAAAALLFALSPGERRSMLAAGLMILPALLVFVPGDGAYWRPDRLFGAAIGIEDALFAFAFAALNWGLVALRYGPLPRLDPLSLAFARRLVPWAAAGTATFFALRLVGLAFMPANLVTLGLAALALLALRPRLGGMMAFGAASLTAYYLAGMGLASGLFGADLHELWTPGIGLGPRLLGFPVEEFLWSGGFGAVWAPLLVHLAGPPGR